MIREAWEEAYPEAVVFINPSYETALIGCTEDGRAVYDFDKMVAELMAQDGIDETSAIEFIEYNTIRALGYVEEPPIIIDIFDEVL